MNEITLTIPLTDDVLKAIGKAVADSKPKSKPPLTVGEFRAAMSNTISTSSIYRMIDADRLKRIEGVGRVLIPYSELERLLKS